MQRSTIERTQVKRVNTDGQMQTLAVRSAYRAARQEVVRRNPHARVGRDSRQRRMSVYKPGGNSWRKIKTNRTRRPTGGTSYAPAAGRSKSSITATAAF